VGIQAVVVGRCSTIEPAKVNVAASAVLVDADVGLEVYVGTAVKTMAAVRNHLIGINARLPRYSTPPNFRSRTPFGKWE
jgi:hypothetical protein